MALWALWLAAVLVSWVLWWLCATEAVSGQSEELDSLSTVGVFEFDMMKTLYLA